MKSVNNFVDLVNYDGQECSAEQGGKICCWKVSFNLLAFLIWPRLLVV